MPDELKHEVPESDGHGHRQHVRHDGTGFIWYKSIPVDGAPSIEGISYSVDVSRGGIGAIAKEPIALGTLLFVELALSRPQQRITAVCRVVHVEQKAAYRHRIGLQFVVVPPDAVHFLAEYAR